MKGDGDSISIGPSDRAMGDSPGSDLLEHGSPLKMLLRMSSEISVEAVKRKYSRLSKQAFADKLNTPGNYATIIRSLPESAVKELSEEMVGLCEEGISIYIMKST